MSITTDKFYNLKIDILSKGKICVETAAVRSIVEKDGCTFLDIYIYRLKKAFMFEKNYVRRIYDLSRDKSYTDIDKFIDDFKEEIEHESSDGADNAIVKKVNKSEEIVRPLLSDIIMMLFIARIDIDNDKLKEKVIFEYITKNIPEARSLSFVYVQKYMAEVRTEKEDFYKSMPLLRNKSQQQAADFYKTLLKICLSDGRMHYAERRYLAEIVQFFRLHNIKLV